MSENDKANKNNDLTGENEPFNDGCTVVEKYKELLEKTRAEVKLNNLNVQKAVVLSKSVDPYCLATPNRIEKARWGAELVKECLRETKQSEIHIRGVHYYIVMKKAEPVNPAFDDHNLKWTQYDNTLTCFAYLSNAVKMSRLFGFIPYSYIVDEKNDVTRVTIYEKQKSYPNIENITLELDIPIRFPLESFFAPEVHRYYNDFDEYIQYVVRNFVDSTFKEEFGDNSIFSSNLVKPFHIELWCEKTLPKYIKRIEGIDKIIEGEGEISITLAHEFIEQLNCNEQDGVILYISDFDPKGNDMPVSIARKIQTWKYTGELKQNGYLLPILLTKEQVIKYGLPQKPIDDEKRKNLGSQAERFDNKADGYTEIQAIEVMPEVYIEIIENAVNKWNDYYSDISKAIDNTVKPLKEQIKQAMEGEINSNSEIKEMFESIVELADETEEAMPDFEEMKKEYEIAMEGLNEKNKTMELIDVLHDVWRSVELPELIYPKVKKNPPMSCLYDSRRNDNEQTMLLQRYKKLGEWS